MEWYSILIYRHLIKAIAFCFQRPAAWLWTRVVPWRSFLIVSIAFLSIKRYFYFIFPFLNEKWALVFMPS